LTYEPEAKVHAAGGLTPGDWLDASVGLVSLAISVVIAILVYRLQRRDSKVAEESVAKAEHERQHKVHLKEADARKEEREREQRAIRRERHSDDYRAASQALNALEAAFLKVARNVSESRLLTEDEMARMDVKTAQDTLGDIRARIPNLGSTLLDVSHHAMYFEFSAIPGDHEFLERIRRSQDRQLALHEMKDEKLNEKYKDLIEQLEGDGISRQICKVVYDGFRQIEQARKGLSAIARAREAITREWGA
jgi:hypothetical protein